MANIFKLHTARVYLNNQSMAQMASEVTLPAVKHKMATHSPTALKFSFEIPIAVEPMEVKVKGDFDAAFIAAALDSSKTHRLQIYSDLIEMDDAKGLLSERQVVAYMTVFFKEFTPSALKQGEATEVEFTASVLTYKLEVDGATEYDLQPLSNKHEIRGFNINAKNNVVLGG